MLTIPFHNQTAAYRNESTQKPPRRAEEVGEVSAGRILQAAYAETASVWRGDFHNAKQVLAALKKRVRKPAKTGAAPAETFHKYRLAQAQQSRLANMLLVEIGSGFTLDLPRAPDIQAALADIYGEPNTEPFLLPLNQLLGFIGAHEWHKKGVEIAALGGRIHVPFGVFSPLRGEYLDLAAQAPLPECTQTAFDIGTGSGVLAAVLARRGIGKITATDTNPRAAACARANLQRLGYAKVEVLEQDLFPEGRADLVVCNPPWLPAKPTSPIEAALYDPDHAMLKAFLHKLPQHLNKGGEAWLILSDLAEHLGLRAPHDLAAWIDAAGLKIISKLSTRPIHPKAGDKNDPLAFARRREEVFLLRLQAA